VGDVASLVEQVEAVTQIQGDTNPGDGINRAMEVLNTSGNQGREQVICLSTDGLPNLGADVATARTNAMELLTTYFLDTLLNLLRDSTQFIRLRATLLVLTGIRVS
jgi:hypothetical protein